MERFEHLSMVTFLILGLALVRLMTSYGSLFARNVIANEHKGDSNNSDYIRENTLTKVNFYWLHNILVLITFLTIIIFWWNVYPLNNLDFMPDNKWNLFSYLLFLLGPFIFFMLCDIIVPSNRDNIEINLKIYYYKHTKLIIGLCILLQISFLINLLFFFQEDISSTKCIGRIALIIMMTPLFFSKNEKIHQSVISIFFIGFVYTVLKYHIYS